MSNMERGSTGVHAESLERCTPREMLYVQDLWAYGGGVLIEADMNVLLLFLLGGEGKAASRVGRRRINGKVVEKAMVPT